MTTNLIGVAVVEDGHAVSFRKNDMLCELLLKSSLQPFPETLHVLYILRQKQTFV